MRIYQRNVECKYLLQKEVKSNDVEPMLQFEIDVNYEMSECISQNVPEMEVMDL